MVQSYGTGPDTRMQLVPIVVNREGKRVPSLEKRYQDCFQASTIKPIFDVSDRSKILHEYIEPTLHRELGYRGVVTPEKGYSTELIAWVEMS